MRVSDSTITMRVKLVSITSSAGAIASTVSSRMMTMLWLGLPFGFLLSSVPVRLPRSIEIDPRRCRPSSDVPLDRGAASVTGGRRERRAR